MGNRSEIGARGFTLIELIVTLLVVAVAIGLVAPAIGRSTEGVRARAEVAGFSATLRHAREQAITTRQTLAPSSSRRSSNRATREAVAVQVGQLMFSVSLIPASLR